MRIAIVKLSALGDIVHAMVVLQFIKRHLPDSRIDWIVEEGFAGLLADNPDIDQILTVRLKALKRSPSRLFEEIRKIKSYARRQYDIVIDLQGLIKSGILSRMLGSVAGFDRYSIREKAASLFYHNDFTIPYEMNVIERNMALVNAALELDIPLDALKNKEPFLYFGAEEMKRSVEYISQKRKNILYILGSSWESKIYPPERMAKVVNELGENALLVWGGDSEYEAAKLISGQSGAKILPKLTLGELKALVSQADLVIGGDSGPTHFAWALNRPSITLFGPTPAERNILESDINKTISSASLVDPLHLDRNDFSIAEIEPAEIVVLARRLLGTNDVGKKDAA